MRIMWVSVFLSTNQLFIDYWHPEILRNVMTTNTAAEYVHLLAQSQHMDVKLVYV